MTVKSKRILAIIFVAMIFIVGITTVWNCRHTISGIVKESSYLHCKSELEDSIDKNIFQKNQWINVNGLLHRIMCETIVRGSGSEYDVYKLSNGQIMYNLDERDMRDYAGQLVKLDNELNKLGIGLTYVQLPNKIKDDSYMPPGTKTYGNINADNLVALLREESVDTIDIREEIEKAGLDWSSLFFKTDHHWLPTTGLWASGIIMEHLGDRYNYPINKSYYDYENYDSEVHENWMLGAVGRRVGVLYDGLDDIEILNPKFQTDFDLVGISDAGTDHRAGSFYDSMYLWDNLKNRADFVNNSYSTYIGKEYSIATVENKLNKNGMKILLIRDSFSCAITPFISLNASSTKNIDLRRYKKNILKLCKEYQPDAVVVAYNPSAFSKKQFDFFK
ncbi:MAG: hypothetical protein KBS56_05050 [Clostridiales bacterium]|nr:hypothetical protein [Candidatus Crickella equi]